MFEKSNIVKIKSINKEGIILNIGLDVHTQEKEYCISTNENVIYFVRENDIILIDTLDNRLKQYKEKYCNNHIDA